MDLEDIKSYFDSKFEAIAKKSLEISNKKPSVLKRKGNQAQLDHELEVLSHVEFASQALGNNSEETAQDHLAKAITLINKRIKLVKLADKSENGWATVEQYVSDDLASDSDDDKKIRRAENRAEQKRKRSHKQLPTTYTNKRFKDVYNGRNSFGGPSGVPRNKPFFRNSGASRASGSNGSCFGCGKFGHYRNQCNGSKPQA